jgi:hypothetical protein
MFLAPLAHTRLRWSATRSTLSVVLRDVQSLVDPPARNDCESPSCIDAISQGNTTIIRTVYADILTAVTENGQATQQSYRTRSEHLREHYGPSLHRGDTCNRP